MTFLTQLFQNQIEIAKQNYLYKEMLMIEISVNPCVSRKISCCGDSRFIDNDRILRFYNFLYIRLSGSNSHFRNQQS